MRIEAIVVVLMGLGCTEYALKGEDQVEPEVGEADTSAPASIPDDTGPSDTEPSDSEPGDTSEPKPEDTGAPETVKEEEVCNGIDDDGDGEIDEGFDSNKNGIPDCLEEEAYCTPFDAFSDWTYEGDGDWHIEDDMLTEGRGGLYDAVAWLYDLGAYERFAIQVDVAWTGSLNDLAGIVWALDDSGEKTQHLAALWDDPQDDYGRYTPPGAVDISKCIGGVCTRVALAYGADLFRVADRSFSTLLLSVYGDQFFIDIDGENVLAATLPEFAGLGPGVVGLYSNDNDGGVWFDNYCVWVGKDVG